MGGLDAQDGRCVIALFKIKEQQWEKLLCDLQLSMKCSLAFRSQMGRASLHFVQRCILPSWERRRGVGRGKSNLSQAEIKPMWFPRRRFTDSFEN